MATAVNTFTEYQTLLRSFERSLQAGNFSPHTVRLYMSILRRFGEFLTACGMPTNVASISREHVEEYLAETLRTRKANTAANRHRALRAYFRWLLEEGEIQTSPMRNIKPPRVPEEPPEVLTEEQLARFLKACEGKDFDSRRDLALIRLLLDTGLRRSELAGLKVEDVDLDLNVAGVVGKFRRPRAVPFGRKTALAIDRYFRVRAQHRYADLPHLWLGRRGPIQTDGVYDIIQKRAAKAGLGKIHPHLFRHTFAHSWLSQGGQEQDLMMLAGVGGLGRCWAATGPRRLLSGHERPIGASALATVSEVTQAARWIARERQG